MATVSNGSGCPKGAVIPELPGSVGLLGTNEPMGDSLARSDKLGRTAAVEE